MHQKPAEIKKLFVREFSEFKREFASLWEGEDFGDMLNEYMLCENEIGKLSNLPKEREVYILLKDELKNEIQNYIIRKLNHPIN